MGKAIRKAAWMGEATRAEALAKLAGFGYKIGYPDTWRDYSSLEIGRASYAANRMAAVGVRVPAPAGPPRQAGGQGGVADDAADE